MFWDLGRRPAKASSRTLEFLYRLSQSKKSLASPIKFSSEITILCDSSDRIWLRSARRSGWWSGIRNRFACVISLRIVAPAGIRTPGGEWLPIICSMYWKCVLAVLCAPRCKCRWFDMDYNLVKSRSIKASLWLKKRAAETIWFSDWVYCLINIRLISKIKNGGGEAELIEI